MFFRISGTPVSVVGTMHFLPEDFRVSPQWIEEAKSADEILGEINHHSDPAPFAQYTDGTKLSDVLDPRLYSRLVELWAAEGMNAEVLPISKPWAASLFLSINIIKNSLAGGVGVEGQLQPHFSPNQKISALEHPDDQWRAFAGGSHDEQMRRLTEIIEDPSLALRRFEVVRKTWLTGDPYFLWQTMAESEEMKAFPDYLRRVFLDRHEKWRPKLTDAFRAKHRTLIMVGAGHLAGPNGVLTIAKEAGFEPLAVA